MYELTVEERFTLVALQRSSRGKTSIALAYVTGMPIHLVEKAILKLEDLHLVESILSSEQPVYLPIDLGSEPIVANYTAWLLAFRQNLVASTESRPVDLIFASARLILVAAVLTGSRDKQFVASLTSLPIAFVTLMLSMMEMQDVWSSERVLHLDEVIRDGIYEFDEVELSLNRLMEEFTDVCWIPELSALIETAHSGTILFDSSEPGTTDPEELCWVN